MDGPLVDAEQFPRNDIDIVSVREARRQIICTCAFIEFYRIGPVSYWHLGGASRTCTQICIFTFLRQLSRQQMNLDLQDTAPSCCTTCVCFPTYTNAKLCCLLIEAQAVHILTV